jgi:hypothetical protein
MKKIGLIVFAAIFWTQLTSAQTAKTGVLVIGNGSGAIGASIQSALSGVKTTLLSQEPDFTFAPLEKNIHSGVEAEFLKRMRKAKGIKDQNMPVYADHTSSDAVAKAWLDSVKNLTQIKKIKWSRIKRSGNGWTVILSNGQTIKAKVLVDADQTGEVTKAVGVPLAGKQWRPFSYASNVYKSSIASGTFVNSSNANYALLSDFQVAGQENLLVLNGAEESMNSGQAAGAAAAYAVFFDTKTSKINLKMTQGELMKYGLALIPFKDVLNTDSNWKAIQVLGLSGFLKGTLDNGVLNFEASRLVSVAEIKDPIKAYYYKAQIWFDDYKAAEMTIQSTLNLLCFVGNKSPENTLAEVKKKWEKNYGFKEPLDLKRNITRREFAALVNDYLKPFDVNLDASGNVLR